MTHRGICTLACTRFGLTHPFAFLLLTKKACAPCTDHLSLPSPFPLFFFVSTLVLLTCILKWIPRYHRLLHHIMPVSNPSVSPLVSTSDILGPATALTTAKTHAILTGFSEAQLDRPTTSYITTSTRPSSSAPTLDSNLTSPGSRAEAPGDLIRPHHPFNHLFNARPSPLGTPASRAAPHSFATFANATPLQHDLASDSFPWRQHRPSSEIPSSIKYHYSQQLVCLPTILSPRSPQVLVGTGSNSAAAAPSQFALTESSPSDIRAAKKSRQGRHRTACDRCRWRKSKVSILKLPC